MDQPVLTDAQKAALRIKIKNALDKVEPYAPATTYVAREKTAPFFGQNTRNPTPAFRGHALLKDGDVLYDPSYGKVYANLAAFENEAIVAFVRTDSVKLPLSAFGVLDANNFVPDPTLNVYLLRYPKANVGGKPPTLEMVEVFGN